MNEVKLALHVTHSFSKCELTVCCVLSVEFQVSTALQTCSLLAVWWDGCVLRSKLQVGQVWRGVLHHGCGGA